MTKRKKKYKYDELDEKNLDKLWFEIKRFIKSRCETDDVGDLPVEFQLRSRRLHYPFGDLFLISKNDEQIDRATELAVTNAHNAMDRVQMLFKIKSIVLRDAAKKKLPGT